MGFLKALPLMIALATGGYMYHNYIVMEKDKMIAQLETNYERSKNNVIRLETALDVSEESRVRVEQNAARQQQAIGELSEKNNELARTRDEYLEIFKSHDLTNLARMKPGLIEPRINRGTQNVFESIESDSREVSDADS